MLDNAFKEIANEAPSMLWVSDQKKDFIFYNTAWLDFRGTSLDEEVARSFESIVHPQDLVRVQKKFQQSFDDRKPYKIEFRIKRHDGAYRWIIESGRPHYTREYKFTGFIGSCMEIHNIKELGKRKENFITAASHELKTPLTSLNVFLHLIDEHFKSNGPSGYEAYSGGAIVQLNKVTALVEQLLDLNKIQTGALDYEWSDFTMTNVVSAVVDKVRLMYPGRTIHWSNGEESLIRGDYERISQVIEILLSNAIKYSDDHTEVLADVSKTKTYVIITILDYGIGIDNEYQTKIFDRFFRIPGQKERTYPGMGMGLYLARKIVEKHNGKIGVESVKNQYTRFNVRLPLLNK